MRATITTIEILAKAGQRLGYAIINYTHMMDIRTYILSGGVSKAGEWLFNPKKLSKNI